MLPCAAHVSGEYGMSDMYVGVPVVIGADGVERIVEINLDSDEKTELKNSIKAVKGLMDAAVNIAPDLS